LDPTYFLRPDTELQKTVLWSELEPIKILKYLLERRKTIDIFYVARKHSAHFFPHLYYIYAALLCKIAALRSFSMDKLQYWRESASGISSLAHFLAKDTIDLFSTLVKPLIYLSMFYFFSNPRSSFESNYAVLVCLVYCVTGMAYALAIYFEPAPAQLVWIISVYTHFLTHNY
jgi:hypothetical protein